ncbi:hypothetical protein [Actinocatenispora rupis]|uniref:Uncharacterized protein n=1 Tax=Actinocatenispora rupis TaxID=519421 RepID=A0A8J3NFJ7_9ACTN|nr:hypothetical protein [Actinocatenispora rupis]GID15382.1 hypothetical protein Aru02nite_62710 [Actinocatenispora rupis]
MTAAGRHLQALLSAADDPAEALAALLAAGGWEALGEADRRLVARSIDERRRAEPAAPVESDGWYAVRTADPAAVADEFGLAVRFPVTLRWGTAALYGDPDSLVFISPVLDGWTLVFDALSPGTASSP